MTALAILVGVSLTLWLCTVLAVAYVVWKLYGLWKVMRADIAALDRQHKTFAAEVMAQVETRRARVAAFSNEELADVEASLLADSRRRRQEAGQVR